MDIKMTSGFRSRQTVSTASRPTGNPSKNDVENKTAPITDTFQSFASKQLGDRMLSGTANELRLDHSALSPKTLEYFDPDEHDGIDWERLEKEHFGNRQVTLENGDSLRKNVDHMISMYVSVKSTLEEKYGDREDILTEKMNRLNDLLDKSKRQIVSSYEESVGRFYETMGNKGAASSMGFSLSAAIDKRIAQMEEVAKIMNSFADGSGSSYIYKQLVMEVWAFNQREEKPVSGDTSSEDVSPKVSLSEDNETYSLKDLEVAGMAAKATANMNIDGLGFMSDEELGICLASRYMKMACLLSHMGTGENMSHMILKSFETFLNQSSGNALSGSSFSARTYKYALMQYRSTGDLREAVTQTGRKYASDSFFSDFRHFGGSVSMSLSTRYNLDLDQFVRDLENIGANAVLPSISGTGIHGFSAYM